MLNFWSSPKGDLFRKRITFRALSQVAKNALTYATKRQLSLYLSDFFFALNKNSVYRSAFILVLRWRRVKCAIHTPPESFFVLRACGFYLQ